MHHLGGKTGSYVYQSLKFQIYYEVRPVVRPILSFGMLISTGVQDVFDVEVNSSYIQLPDGHKIPMIRENGAMVCKRDVG